MKKPNIVIFMPDEMRADVMGHLGHPSGATPNLDSFVKTEAISFENAFCQNPVCTPSRCSFMSGWYPHVRGHRIQHFMMQENEPVLLKDLKREGYKILWAGKNDLIPGNADFDLYCDIKHEVGEEVINLHKDFKWRAKENEPHYYSFMAGDLDNYYNSPKSLDEDNVEAALDFIENNSDSNDPFCVYMPLLHPHPPYASKKPWIDTIDMETIPPLYPSIMDLEGKPSCLKAIKERQNTHNLTKNDFIEIKKIYLAMVRQIDDQFAQVCNKLKEKGLYDDTLILFFSDHGDFAGDYGLVEKTQNTFEDCLTRVPLIIKPPTSKTFKPGIRKGLVELVDIPATVADICNLELEHDHFGRSLSSFFINENLLHRDTVFCEGGRLQGENQAKELASKEDQIQGALYWPRLSIQKEDYISHGKAVMVRNDHYKYVYRLYEEDELYDLREDPHETINRIKDRLLFPILTKMKERLLKFYIETGDVVPRTADSR